MQLLMLWQNIHQEATNLATAIEQLPDECECGDADAHPESSAARCDGVRTADARARAGDLAGDRKVDHPTRGARRRGRDCRRAPPANPRRSTSRAGSRRGAGACARRGALAAPVRGLPRTHRCRRRRSCTWSSVAKRSSGALMSSERAEGFRAPATLRTFKNMVVSW